MHRRMRDRGFQAAQWQSRYEAHVEPINRLIDDLGAVGKGGIPYVAPLYGGVNSKVLFLFQDPGPMTDASRSGSGFLCSENDDPSAELFATCLDKVGLSVNQILTWNAYPWNLPAGRDRPTSGMLNEGTEPLQQLLDLLPALRVVVAMGGVAQDGWNRFERRFPKVASSYIKLDGLHTSRRGITSGGQHSKDVGIQRVFAVMQEALGACARRP